MTEPEVLPAVDKDTDILLWERRLMAVELRKQGLSYPQIARDMGVTAREAYQLVSSALRDLRNQCRESVAELRDIETARLDAMLHRLLPLAGATADSEVPIFDAIDRVLKIMERKAKLHGLDAPQKKVVEGNLTMGHYSMEKPPESDEESRRFLQDALGPNF